MTGPFVTFIIGILIIQFFKSETNRKLFNSIPIFNNFISVDKELSNDSYFVVLGYTAVAFLMPFF